MCRFTGLAGRVNLPLAQAGWCWPTGLVLAVLLVRVWGWDNPLPRVRVRARLTLGFLKCWLIRHIRTLALDGRGIGVNHNADGPG